MEQEVWTDIPDYEWLYQLWMTSLSVKSLWRERIAGSISYYQQDKILKPIKHNAWYSVFCLCKKWVIKKAFRHRIVASIFIWKCPEWMFVLHNDWNPENDNPSNLRYWTHTENMRDAVKHWSHYSNSKWKFWWNHPSSKCIEQYTMWGYFIQEFPSAIEASIEVWWLPSPIRACASWLSKSSYWYIWKYK